jgi:VanZ family protein
MLPLRLAPLWAVGGWVGVACALLLSLLPGGPPSPIHVWDKLQHCAGYFIMATWFTGIYPRERYGAIALRIVMFGILIEGLQSLTATRTAEIGDVLANATGVGLAVLLARAGLGGWACRLERAVGLGPR